MRITIEHLLKDIFILNQIECHSTNNPSKKAINKLPKNHNNKQSHNPNPTEKYRCNR